MQMHIHMLLDRVCSHHAQSELCFPGVKPGTGHINKIRKDRILFLFPNSTLVWKIIRYYTCPLSSSIPRNQHRLFGASVSHARRSSSTMDLSSFDPSQVPALTPPAGVIPNFIDAETRAPLVRSVACVTMALMLVFLTLRMYTRFRIIGSFDADDCKPGSHGSPPCTHAPLLNTPTEAGFFAPC